MCFRSFFLHLMPPFSQPAFTPFPACISFLCFPLLVFCFCLLFPWSQPIFVYSPKYPCLLPALALSLQPQYFLLSQVFWAANRRVLRAEGREGSGLGLLLHSMGDTQLPPRESPTQYCSSRLVLQELSEMLVLTSEKQVGMVFLETLMSEIFCCASQGLI